MDRDKLLAKDPQLKEVLDLKPTLWINKKLQEDSKAWENMDLSMEDIKDAEARLNRFAPMLMEVFPETRKNKGIIESELRAIPKMKDLLLKDHSINGDLYLKMDSHLAVAGSVKARGGIYEVLTHAEKLALDEGLIELDSDYRILASDKAREFFSQYTIQVGSTGNLGLSIGIASATLGFKVIVHMSSDARQWKKDLLREKGVTVKEYESDYSEAVIQGRAESDKDPYSYFVDDENSVTLFMGYAVAALRLERQLKEQDIMVDKDHPLFVYIPCGVGGAPGGVTFGLKKLFGDSAHVFFVEPTHAPSVLLGMATDLHHDISVQDVGIDGKTDADGLAVGRPSGFVGKTMETILSGIFTIEDSALYDYMRQLNNSEEVQIEPSACAAFEGPAKLLAYQQGKDYIEKHNLGDKLDNITHIAWATGGNLVPQPIMDGYLETYL